MRIISLESGINLQRLSQVELTAAEMGRFTEAIGRISSWPIYLYDKPSLSASQLRLHSTRLQHRCGIDAVFVDYAQLMTGKGYDRRTEMGYVSRQAKEMAKDLNIPVVMLAQLNRNLESRKDKRPILSDLKESGDFEQDTDVVMFLHRDEVYNENTEFPNQADLMVAKNRHGPTGTISLYFERTQAKFMDGGVHRVNLADLE
jgi:replicative DNA helicase